MDIAAVEFYSKTAQDFHASYKADPNRIERVSIWRNFIDRYANGIYSACDIGCGSGILACELARRGIKTFAVDGSPQMLAIARDIADGLGLSNIEFRQHYLPIENSVFMEKTDLVISSSVIEYLDSVRSSLISIGNLLNKNGTLIFSISNHESFSRKMVRVIHKYTGKPEYMKFLRHFMTLADIKSELANTGFDFIEYRYFGKADMINRLLSCFLPEKFSSNMIIVVAKKKVN